MWLNAAFEINEDKISLDFVLTDLNHDHIWCTLLAVLLPVLLEGTLKRTASPIAIIITICLCVYRHFVACVVRRQL